MIGDEEIREMFTETKKRMMLIERAIIVDAAAKLVAGGIETEPRKAMDKIKKFFDAEGWDYPPSQQVDKSV